MMSENKVLLSAFQRVLVSWGDVDSMVPAFAAQRIRFSLQTQNMRMHAQPSLERGLSSGEARPVPWRLSLAATETIDAVTQVMQLISLMPEQVAGQTKATLSQRLTEIRDNDGCPVGWPFPRPKFDKESLTSVDSIFAAVAYHMAAEISSDELITRDLEAIADQLLEQGLQRR